MHTKGGSVPRAHLRASIHRVDPVSTRMRRSVTFRRRFYCSADLNAVWHVDGHHKLIGWRFVIHGRMDTEAVHLHGLQSRVHFDLGEENVEVWRCMIEQHNRNEAVVTGSSTHNERIEQLWRDVY